MRWARAEAASSCSFLRTLVLGAISAAIGLSAAGAGIRWAMRVAEVEMLRASCLWSGMSCLRPRSLRLVLTLIGSAIAGVLPALKVTAGLQQRYERPEREEADCGWAVSGRSLS